VELDHVKTQTENAVELDVTDEKFLKIKSAALTGDS
jgi:hypothetical protein